MVHQELLNIFIGKAGLLNTVPLVGKPVASVIHAVEGVVDVSPPFILFLFLFTSLFFTYQIASSTLRQDHMLTY